MNAIRPYAKVFSTNQNSSAFTAPAATLTRPSGNGVLDLAGTAGLGANPFNWIRLLPYGLGSDNDVFSLRVIGWNRVLPATTALPTIYIATKLIEVSCTISTYVGIAGSQVLATERFADTIGIVALMEQTITSDTTRFGTIKLYTPADQTPAYFDLKLPPVELLTFDTDQTTGTPTANALYLLFSDDGD